MNKIVISNREPQQITIGGGGQVIGITEVLVNGVDVTVGSVAYVVVPTKTSQLQNDSGFLTQETDPTIPYYIKQITQADINSWNSKQNQLVSGVNIKTINDNSILGSGNLDISTSYTAGTGIEITEENVINNTITSYNDLTDLPTIPTKTSDLLNDSDFVTSSELSTVATTGDYDDLLNKPTIPTQTSELENNSGFITNNTDELTYYYTKDYLYNLLPKVSDSGSNISLNNTYSSDLKMILSPSELSQDGTPTPDIPQTIHTISGSNTIKLEGKNKLNGYTKSGTLNGVSYTFENDELTLNGTCTSTGPVSGLGIFEQEANQDYTWTYIYVSGSCTDYGGGLFFGSSTSIYDNIAGAGFRTSQSRKVASLNNSTARTLYLYMTLNVNTTYTNYKIKTQIVKGTTEDYNFVPYQTPQEADVDLDSLEYCKIGYYSDRIFKNVEGDPDYDNTNLEVGLWYIKKNIGKVVLDGSNYLARGTTGTNAYYLSTTIYGLNNNTIEVSMSNMFQPCSFNNRANGLDITYSQNGNINIRTANNTSIDWSTEESCKTWLNANTPTLYYVLATPTYTQIEGTLEDELEEISKAQSKTGQTNITQINNDLPFVISASTLKDISNL